MSYPTELKYTKEHEWVRDNGDGTVTIGITDFAQGELGDIVYVDLNDVDDDVDQDEVFGSVEAVKTVSELFAPIAGTIIEHNEALADDPELVNNDCYGDGWMIKLKMSDSSQLDGLMTSDQYQDII